MRSAVFAALSSCRIRCSVASPGVNDLKARIIFSRDYQQTIIGMLVYARIRIITDLESTTSYEIICENKVKTL